MKRLHVVSIFTLVLAELLWFIGMSNLVVGIPQWIENTRANMEEGRKLMDAAAWEIPLVEEEKSKPFFPTYQQAVDVYIKERNYDELRDEIGKVNRVIHIVDYGNMEVVFYTGENEYQIILGVFLKKTDGEQATCRYVYYMISTSMNLKEFGNIWESPFLSHATNSEKIAMLPLSSLKPILIDGNHFYGGIWMGPKIYTLKIDGQSPDVIRKIAEKGGRYIYLWYYRDLQLDKKHIEIDLD